MSSAKKSGTQPSPGKTTQSSRKCSVGDPANPLFIQGLRLHLSPPWREKNDLFDLFASCIQSNLSLKAETIDESTTELFIENNWVSTGEGQGADKSRNDAATWAMDTLCKFQPCNYKTNKEMLLRSEGRINGLALYMDTRAPSKEKSMDILINSCRKSNLQITWWDDGGGKVFGDGWSAVLFIKSRPICWGVGEDLNAAKKEAAVKAIDKLIGHPVVVINKDTNDDGKSITDRDPCGSTSCEGDKKDVDKDVDTKATNHTSVPGAAEKEVHAETPTSQKRPGSDKDMGIDTKAANPSSVSAAAEKQDTGSPKKQQRLAVPNTMQLPAGNHGSAKLPNFILYLPEKYDTESNKNDDRLILLESCFRSGIVIELDRTYNGNKNIMATLNLRDRKSKKSLTTTGSARNLLDAKNRVATKAVSELRQCQPCVYSKVQFLRGIDRVHGLTLYLSKRKTFLSQLENSCAKCNLQISWWDDGRSYLFGPPWAVVLLINSWPICWGCGGTSAEAKEKVAEKAVSVLRSSKHPVVYENQDTKSKSETITGQDDKRRFDVLSEWHNKDGNQLGICGLSNKLIERHLQKLLLESV